MKKRMIVVFLALAVMLTGFLLTGCQAEDGGGQYPSQSLTLNKKYIYKSDVTIDKNKQTYYIFYLNGTGEYHAYYYYNGSRGEEITKYTVRFKYITVEDMAVCFYDSVSYAEEHNQGEVSTISSWTATLAFSEDILLSTANALYICEDYLPQIPNFGKVTA